MLLKLIQFELQLHRQQTLFRIACIVFLFLGIAFGNGTLGAGLQKDSPYSIAFLTSVLSLGTVIIIAIFSGTAILRDRDAKMEGILFATNMTHAQYVLSRFIGLFLATLTCFSMTCVGFYLAHFMPWADPTLMSNYNPLTYLWSLLIMGVPNILLGTAIIFATAALTRNNMATYLSGVFLYVTYWIGSIVGHSPLLAANSLSKTENPGLASLLDPYGLIALLNQTRYWSVLQKNTQYPQLVEYFLYNRLFWLGIALTIFALTYRFFSFRSLSLKTKPKTKKNSKQEAADLKPFRPIKPVAMTFAAQTRIGLAQTAMNFKTLIKGVPFYALLILWTLLIGITVMESLRASTVGIPFQPLTGLFLGNIIESFMAMGSMVVIFFAFELRHQERDHGFDGIYDATPASNLSFLLGKLGALALLILTLIIYTALIAILIQTSNGAESYNIPLYASLVYRVGLPLLCIAALALLIANGVANKYAGLGLCFLYTLFFSGAIFGRSVYLEHPLLRFGLMPEFKYSPMIGAAHSDDAHAWMLLFWLGCSGILCVIALRYWRRGPWCVPQSLSHGGRILLAISSLVTLASGAFLLYQFHVVSTYRSHDSQQDWQALYEQTYGPYEHQPAPQLSDANLQIDLYPEDREYKIQGSLELVNETQKPLDRLLVGISDQVTTYRYQIPGATQNHDPNYSHTWITLAEPLPVGESLTMSIELRVHRDGFDRLDAENYIFPNYTYIEPDKMLPFFGINHGMILKNAKARAKRGLPPRQMLPSSDAHETGTKDQMTYRIVASTPANQQLVMPGVVVSEWQEAGRRFQEVTSDGPKPQRFAIASGIWQEKVIADDDITITTYTASGHEANLDSIISATQDTIRYGSAHFSPFDSDTFRIAEIPSFSDRFGATAYHNASFAVENRLYLLDQRAGDIDMSYRTMAHEVGHHWWGYQLNPASFEGAAFLTEFLAVYTETAVYEAQSRLAERWQYLDKTNDLYFYMRGYESEVELPLERVQFQPYVYYMKGAHVAHALRELIGTQAINKVLAQFLQEYPFPAEPKARDLVPRLVAAAPIDQQARVQELLSEVVVYNFSLRKAERDAKNPAKILLELPHKKIRINPDGSETQMPMTDIDLGLYQDNRLIKEITLPLEPDRNTYELEIDDAFDTIQLDPRRLHLDITRDDNQRRISPL